MPIDKKKLIVGVTIIFFLSGIAAFMRYETTALRSAEDSRVWQSDARNAPAIANNPAMKVEAVEVMVERLRKRLLAEPNDLDGWVLLGRSYHHLERWDDAKAAFARARELGYAGENNVDHAPRAVLKTQTDEAVFDTIGSIGSTVMRKEAAESGEDAP